MKDLFARICTLNALDPQTMFHKFPGNWSDKIRDVRKYIKQQKATSS